MLHMKHIFRHILLAILSISLVFSAVNPAQAATSNKDTPVYTTLRSIDLGTFNEYRYKITEKFFTLKEHFEIHETMSLPVLKDIGVLADTGYKYLPDNLENKNYLNALLIELQKGVRDPDNEIIYVEIIKAIAAYLEKVDIESIQGDIIASPRTGNAPLNVTLRSKVQDPSGTQIRSGNYTWWIDNGGQKQVIGRGPSINYTFHNEGTFSVFLDVTSSHKNKAGFTDVLPLSERVDIAVNEKIASLIVKVNSDRVDNDELKFTPEDANYGLIFDATSSTPTAGTKFSRTEWDFGNGVRKGYNAWPKIERVRYGREGDYNVVLRLFTNEGKVVERNFTIYVHNPIARIEVNREDGYIGDKFTFAAKSSGIYRDLTYNWEIINIDTDRVVHQKSDKILTYSFTDKGKYNVKLKVRRSSGEVDQDTRVVYVTSQSPIAEFDTEIPLSNKPNRVFFDATRSYDPDFTDDGNLSYDWFIDGNRVILEDANKNGSIGYYTFDSVGTHSVNLEVTDPDGITAVKKGSVEVDSILAVEMFAFPRVIKRDSFIKFVAESPEAQVYEWDFGDGKNTGGNFDKVTHTFEKSGKFDVKVTVSDKENKTNSYIQTIYVSESNKPLAFIEPTLGGAETPIYDAGACSGGAYITDRVSTITLKGDESINIDGEKRNLQYSWKIGNTKFSSSPTVSHRFDEIGCFPVKLTVKSNDNGSTDVREVMFDVRNALPTMTALDVKIEDLNADPVIVNVTAQGAKDPDGVIQSYLWYYYTDIDTTPQDFRATSSINSTSFVIPKVTGNYYFVAILKDNNEARITSEEATGGRSFETISGDNINTPIVELTVNDNSATIGEELTFTAKAHNILDQNIEKDSTFSWDFDGDGFYDTQTNEPTVTYKYRKSGEFYAKVKVKYKGVSSTKNITVNVSNKLVPDFEYISIGNKYIFFDSSHGQIDSRQWDLGDGTKKSGTYFEHTYTDGKASHTVKLKITEGSKVKEVEKVVTKNIKNILKIRGKQLVAFTSPQVDADGKIVLDTPSARTFVYLGESSDEVVAYAIDYDIDHDSDLNGGADDDEDNKGTASYVSGDVIEIPLSQYKTQKVRIFIKDADGNVLASEDIEIEKTYIEETEIDPSTIIFEDVTESEKEKIEALKSELLKLPQQQKLKALAYVQKLQENWNDNTEKTRTILDFENYIFELGLSNEDELISILESLLVEGQEDQSARNITYQALVNLIPTDITCAVEGATCYESLLAKLEDIKNSNDIEYNKTLGKEVLEVIGATEVMTNQQKLDFKAILTSLVYGGDPNAIPEEEKNEVIAEPIPQGDTSEGGFMSYIILIAKIIGYFLLTFIVIIAVFYVIYLIFGKKKNITFTQFISNTTSFGKDEAGSKVDAEDDILADFGDQLKDTKKEEKLEDPLFSAPAPEKKVEAKTQTSKTAKEKAENNEVPDWLKGNFADDSSAKKQEAKPETKPEIKPEAKKQEQKDVKKEAAKKPDTAATSKQTSDENVPDWLKGSFSDDAPKKKDMPKSEAKKPAEKKTQEPNPETPKADKKSPVSAKAETVKEEKFDLEKDTKIEEQSIPDWLKGSMDIASTSEKTEDTSKAKQEKKQEAPKTEVKSEAKVEKKVEDKKEEAKEKTSEKKAENTSSDNGAADVSVPDWLKGSLDTDTPAKQENPKKQESKKTDTPEVKKDAKTTVKKTADKKPAANAKKADSKTDASSEKNGKKENKKDELWDDGMKVPDWLKADE